MSLRERLLGGVFGRGSPTSNAPAPPRPGTGGWTEILPDWSYEPAVAEVAHFLYERQIAEEKEIEPLPLQCVTGPAVKKVLLEMVCMWFFAVLLPWPVLWRTPDPADGISYAKYPPVETWLCCAPFIAKFMYGEYKILKYAIVPQVQVVKRLHIGVNFKSYGCWLFVSMGISLVSHMDLVTNGLFLAVTIRTALGNQETLWQEVWYQTWKESKLTWIPYTDKYMHCVIFVWILMFIQPLHGLFRSCPVKFLGEALMRMRCGCIFNWLKNKRQWDDPDDFDYEMQDGEYAWDFTVNNGAGPTYYQTLADYGCYEYSGHGDTLIVLAEVSRMSSISMMRDAYVKTKVQYHLDSENSGPAYGLLRNFLIVAGTRIWLFGICESALVTNLQGTLLSMNFYIDHDKFHWQLAGTLLLSTLVGFKRLWDAFWRLEYAYDTIVYNEQAQLIESENMGKLKRLCAVLAFSFWVNYLFLEYVIFKAVALWGWCPNYMWNVEGCADIKVEGLSHHAPDPQVNSWMKWLYFGFAMLCPIVVLLTVWWKRRNHLKNRFLTSLKSCMPPGMPPGDHSWPLSRTGHRPEVLAENTWPLGARTGHVLEHGGNSSWQLTQTNAVDGASAPGPGAEAAGIHSAHGCIRCEGAYVLTAQGQNDRWQTGEYKFDRRSGRIQDGNGKSCGCFSTQGMPPSFKIPEEEGKKPLKCITVTNSEIMVEIQKTTNSDAFFVLPSQLNGAEYQSFERDAIVEKIDEYQGDNTGGPRGQLAVHPAAGQFVLDNAANDIRPDGISAVTDVIKEVRDNGYEFELQNGYLKIPLKHAEGWKDKAVKAWKTALPKFKMLVMEDVPATGLTPDKEGFSAASHCVNLVYASAVPVKTYNNGYGDMGMQIQVAGATLVAQYYGALSIAARRGSPSSPRVVYLMPLGGGVFENPPDIIVKGMSLAVEMLTPEERECLDVHILTFHRNNAEVREFRRLLGVFQKLNE